MSFEFIEVHGIVLWESFSSFCSAGASCSCKLDWLTGDGFFVVNSPLTEMMMPTRIDRTIHRTLSVQT